MRASLLPTALAVAMVACCGAWAHAQESQFRDLVRKYVNNPTKDAAVAILPGSNGVDSLVALEYTVLLRKDGDEQPVDPNTYQFKIGDEIRVRIQPLSQCYIYIFHEGASGEQTCLLPTAEEKPPRAEKDKSLDLPDDGYFEFAPPPGDEKLIVVATETPIAELSVLSNVVFKKADADLTEEEKKLRDKLKSIHTKTFTSIRDRQAEKTTFRGILTDAAREKVLKEMQASGKTRSLSLEEPPTGKTASSFAMVASPAGAGKADLLIRIPLRSIGLKP